MHSEDGVGGSCQVEFLPGVVAFRMQAPVVNRVGDKLADRRGHAPGGGQEDAGFRGDGGTAVEQVFQAGLSRVAGMDALGGLAELTLRRR